MNKAVQQSRLYFEGGEVLQPIGGHQAEYVDCPNKHLWKTFLHLDVQKRGCTRIEVSLYACTREDLSTNIENFLQDALETVSPDGDGLFLVQPPKRQWENLAKVLDRCLVLADRPQGNIFLAWYAHTKTGRVSGVYVRPKPAKVEDDSTWERAIQWTIGDFGFRTCPIFRIDILAAGKEDVEFGSLRCSLLYERTGSRYYSSSK